MNVFLFYPNFELAKNITVSLASQTVDLDADAKTNLDQIRIANTSTGAVAVKWGKVEDGAITAAFTDGNGLIIPAGHTEYISKFEGMDRFAVIGASANGTVQICPGTGV